MADNTLTLKLDADTAMPLIEKIGKDIVLPIVNEAGKSAYAIAVAHGFQGTEQEWLNSLRGPKGDPGVGSPGKAFTYEDFTPDQLAALKGPKGDPGSAEKSAKFLNEHGIWVKDTSIDTVLMKVIELSNCYNNFVPKPLEYFQPVAGQEFLDLKGEPHFKVSVNGGEKRVFESDNMRVPIKAFGEDDIRVSYFDLADHEVGTISIKGLESTTADETFTDATGAEFARHGKKLILTLNDYNGGDFNWLGKWSKADIETIEIKSNKTKILKDYSLDNNRYNGLTFIIKQPQNISFEVNSADLGTVRISTLERSFLVRLQYSLEWNGATYEQGL